LGHFAVGGHTDRYEMKKSPTGSGRRPLSYTWPRRPRRSTGISARASMPTIRRRRHI